MTITVSELAEKIGAIVVGDGARKISSIASLEEAGPGQASFLSNPKYEKMLGTTVRSGGDRVEDDAEQSRDDFALR